ncbi:MAG: response regulator [Bacteriovoracaceae bacterium]
MTFTDEEIQEFKIEALDLLTEAENALLNVESGSAFKSNYDLIFRSFHSLKGAAGMIELTSLQNHMHKIENNFQLFKEEATLPPKIISYFLTSIDVARALLDNKSFEFDYNLPNAEEKNLPTPKEALANEKSAKTKNLIFIIDDEEDLVEVLGVLMEKYSFDWKGFTDPVEAMSDLEKMNPSLILTDMKMPKMTGLDVLKAAKEINPELPVLFLSGHLDKETLIEALSHGVDGVIEKPFKETYVISQISMAIQQYTMWQLLNKTIDMILFQFQDLEEFLKSKGKMDLSTILKNDVESLLTARRELKKNKLIRPTHPKKK